MRETNSYLDKEGKEGKDRDMTARQTRVDKASMLDFVLIIFSSSRLLGLGVGGHSRP